MNKQLETEKAKPEIQNGLFYILIIGNISLMQIQQEKE